MNSFAITERKLFKTNGYKRIPIEEKGEEEEK
jgi:hypothetical protein